MVPFEPYKACARASFLGFENILRADSGIDPDEIEINGTQFSLNQPRNSKKCVVCIRGEEVSFSFNLQDQGTNTILGRIMDV